MQSADTQLTFHVQMTRLQNADFFVFYPTELWGRRHLIGSISRLCCGSAALKYSYNGHLEWSFCSIMQDKNDSARVYQEQRCVQHGLFGNVNIPPPAFMQGGEC